ncbi:MAG: ATP-binding protein [Collinsella sp.]
MENTPNQVSYTIRISVYDDMLSTPRVIVVEQSDVRTYLEDVTNTVYRTMKEQGGKLSLMIIRELVENFIHAQFSEPVISILDNGNTIRFADQGPGIGDKERAFEFGVTSADREEKRYIRGTGAGLPMVQQYVENAGGAIAVEDNLGAGTVVTVSVDPKRAAELEHAVSRGAAVRSGCALTRRNPCTQAQRIPGARGRIRLEPTRLKPDIRNNPTEPERTQGRCLTA